MKLSIPDPSLVLLVGASGAGKSTFARAHFRPTEVLSSDFCRGLVSDDFNDQSVSADAFDVLRFIAGKRLAAGRLTVVDATNVQRDARRPLVALAREHDLFCIAIVLNLSEKICADRNAGRADRAFGHHVIRNHVRELRTGLRGLRDEGFRHVAVLQSPEEIESVTLERTRLWTDRREDTGPFDIIGDVHGCADELEALLTRLGYVVERGDEHPHGYRVTHPEARRVAFLGDLVDRGPRIVDALRLAMSAVHTGAAICVPGNHEAKLLKKLQGRDVKVSHGLAETLAQLDKEPATFSKDVAKFIDGLVSHFVLDGGKLVVAHAGMKQAYQGRASGRVRSFALFGETTGETDEFGLPVRYDWPAEYRGRAMVVYGHTPVGDAEWVNNTINVDTGCVFGGRLTALRYPEREIVSISAAREYYAPIKPIAPAAPPPVRDGDVLDLDDVLGRRSVETSLRGRVTIREENANAALEVMSRFALDPRWLVYLPPTMSPVETSASDLLEHPAEAFEYFRREGVDDVICQEKHMGSRAVLVVCKDEAAARARFGAPGHVGRVYTRTGRAFFAEEALERQFMDRVRDAVLESGLFAELDTTWLVLDAELMPWSAKALELLRSQYAPVGAAARQGLGAGIVALEQASARGLDVTAMLERHRARADAVDRYVEAYGRYCWPVDGLRGLKLAPFHLLASEGQTHVRRDHQWHMETLGRLASANDLVVATPHRSVQLSDPESVAAATAWWEAMTASGGEGMVVKPKAFVAEGRRGLVQPALKVRGREYLRIIYGPEYLLPGNLERLRQRAVGAKRALALKEFALGVEALERFVRREPLYRVHECVFGVLALESEPIDPRL